MSFLPTEVIKRKRDGKELDPAAIEEFVTHYHQGQLPDYQMSALLMAIVLKGMSKTEAAHLTKTMLHSGETIQFPNMDYLPVDKHSTGGIGDKTSLLIAPIIAACGVPVPMIAGRGLGHTGGTLDKLESIPGFNVNLELPQFIRQVQEQGCAIIGQTKEICPADKKMYALRDVTGTVESLPLICGSILSKKIAEGIKGLTLDVKCGSGAFMKDFDQAKELAEWLVDIAEKNGVRTTALITHMSEPLGRFVGNAIEVWECLSILKNEPVLDWQPNAFDDCKELSLQLSAEMLVLSGHSTNRDEALAQATSALENGLAYKKFEQMVSAQGGQLKDLPCLKTLPWQRLAAPEAGFLSEIDAESVGLAAICLGAGRKVTTDQIDPSASIICHKKIGDQINQGDTLFSIGCKDSDKIEAATQYLEQCYKISLQKPSKPSLILGRVLK